MFVGPRAIAVGFVLAAALFGAAGWLRPPLSRDIGSLRLPVWGLAEVPQDPEILINDARPMTANSIGGLVLGLAGCCLVLVLVRPRLLGVAAGLLVAGAVAANAAAALNHPTLIEVFDFELQQRSAMTDVLRTSVSSTQALCNAGNARITSPSPDGQVSAAAGQDHAWGNPERGFFFLLYGRWLLVWALGWVIIATPGPLSHRLLVLAGWAAAGLALAGGLCGRRLWAEHHWRQAKTLESRRDFPAARQSLTEAVRLYPEFAALERTWVLAGKLDWREGRPTPMATFYRSFQLARTGNQDLEWARATALAEELLADPARGLAVRKHAARLFTAVGLDYYQRPADSEHPLDARQPVARLFEKPAVLVGLTPKERRAQVEGIPGRTGSNRQENPWQGVPLLAGAGDAWQRAGELDPGRRDSALFLGLVRALTDDRSPERADADFQRAMAGLADRLLRADVLTSAGNTYFRASRLAEARQRYAESWTVFSLPKTINFQAMKGLGGL
jgi:tetratricopeptide (TPR) repeat protein